MFIQKEIELAQMSNRDVTFELVKYSKKAGKCIICDKNVTDIEKHMSKHSSFSQVNTLADFY